MPSSLSSLDLLRQEIDAIDDSMHDLLMRRAALVGRIRAAKPAGTNTLRPGREATILRRLLARNDGAYPAPALIRLWREMMGSFAAMQGDVTVTMPACLEPIVRRHLGGAYTYRLSPNEDIALNTLLAGGATLAALSWPSTLSDWWLRLAETPAGPRVVAAIPFLTRRIDHEALIVANLACEETGDDKTLVVIGPGGSMPEAARTIVTAERKRLVEVPRFLSEDDIADLGDAVRIGAYATPYHAES